MKITPDSGDLTGDLGCLYLNELFETESNEFETTDPLALDGNFYDFDTTRAIPAEKSCPTAGDLPTGQSHSWAGDQAFEKLDPDNWDMSPDKERILLDMFERAEEEMEKASGQSCPDTSGLPLKGEQAFEELEPDNWGVSPDKERILLDMFERAEREIEKAVGKSCPAASRLSPIGRTHTSNGEQAFEELDPEKWDMSPEKQRILLDMFQKAEQDIQEAVCALQDATIGQGIGAPAPEGHHLTKVTKKRRVPKKIKRIFSPFKIFLCCTSSMEKY